MNNKYNNKIWLLANKKMTYCLVPELKIVFQEMNRIKMISFLRSRIHLIYYESMHEFQGKSSDISELM